MIRRLAVRVGNLVFRSPAYPAAAAALGDTFAAETRVAEFVAAFAPLIMSDPLAASLLSESDIATMLADMLTELAREPKGDVEP